MLLWIRWRNAISLLRPAFSRLRSFLWFTTAVAGLTVRTELLGVTASCGPCSYIRVSTTSSSTNRFFWFLSEISECVGCGGYRSANSDYLERNADVRVATRHSYCIHCSVLRLDHGIPLLRQESIEHEVKVAGWSGRPDIDAFDINMRNWILRLQIP
jgi:hypothetical protein